VCAGFLKSLAENAQIRMNDIQSSNGQVGEPDSHGPILNEFKRRRTLLVVALSISINPSHRSGHPSGWRRPRNVASDSGFESEGALVAAAKNGFRLDDFLAPVA
jgi:hypothetical protein